MNFTYNKKTTQRLIFRTACVLFALSIFGCRNEVHKNNNISIVLPKIDSFDGQKTYKILCGKDAQIIDSTYRGLLAATNSYHAFDLMHEHVYYYGLLTGDRIFAKATVAKYKGISYCFLTKYDSSNAFFDEAIRLYSKMNRPADLAECYYNKAMNYFHRSDYAGAFKCDYTALNIYESLKDSAGIFRLKTEIGDDYLRNRQYDKAIAILLKCLDYYHKHNRPTNETYSQSLLGQCYQAEHDSVKALEYFSTALATDRRIGDKMGVSACLNNIASIYMLQKRWDKAMEYFNESLAIISGLNEQRQIPIIRENIASCLWQMGKGKIAQQMLLKEIDTAKQRKEELRIAHAYDLLAVFNKKEGQYKDALKYYELYKAHSDSIFNKEREHSIAELNVKYESSKKDAEILELNAEKRINETTVLMDFFATGFIILIALLIIVYLRSRNKENKLLIEKVQLDLEINKKELQYFTESIISKNKLIEELEQKLENKVAQDEVDESSNQLSQLYQLKILTDDDWRQFKILFDKVNPGLINRLRMKYPELSPAEERQFLLIKLKMSNKEAADMLGISPLSIKKNRYRLKKRFGLLEQDDLDEFVEGF
jgi:tetratricopeptide (TPR) repeat protein